MSPWIALLPDFVTTLMIPPVARPYSASYPPVFTSMAWMNSKFSSFPWKPYSEFVVFTPST